MRSVSRPPMSPQEKKAHSLARDCRDGFGDEHDKGSRKTVPRRKAAEARRDRHKTAQVLSGIGRLDEAGVALAESSARHDTNRVGGWRKASDIPLAQYLVRQKERRLRRAYRRKPRRQPRVGAEGAGSNR